jgi:ring-1,2-phenylacetyl-CoA epoxidase subunit PaaA
VTTLVTDVREKPERIYAPLQFEASDEMPEEYRRLVLRLLRETNEIGSVKVCYDQMRDMTKNVSLAPDPVSRVRIVEFFADEMRHQKIFDGVVRAMGEIPGEDFVSSIDGLNATSSVREWVDLALLNHFIDRVGAFQLLDYELSSFAPLSRAGVAVAKDEFGHCAMGFQHLIELCRTDEGRASVEARLPTWYGYALDMFGTRSGTRQWKYIEFGLKTKSNEELRQEYLVHIAPFFDRLGIEQPDPASVPRKYA